MFIIRWVHCNNSIVNSITKRTYCLKFCEEKSFKFFTEKSFFCQIFISLSQFFFFFSFIILGFHILFDKKSFMDCNYFSENPRDSEALNCFFPWFFFIVSVYVLLCVLFAAFFNVFSRATYLGCWIIWIGPKGNIYSSIRCSYLSVLPDANADIYAASLLILNCNFLFPIFFSIVIITLDILSNKVILKKVMKIWLLKSDY